MSRGLHLQVHDSAFDPDTYDRSTIEYRRGESLNYRVFIFLDGLDLPFVQHVMYRLPTAVGPPRLVARMIDNQRCKFDIWTWGVFELIAEVVLKDGSLVPFPHQLEFSHELTLPGVEFIER
jgi:hypothetical protein